MIMEEWKDVIGYEGLYQVSNHGIVKRDGHVLKNLKHNTGYLFVQLSKNGKVQNKFIHRLVAEAFLPNPFNHPQVNHLDECKDNNCVTNLEWCTAKYNSCYGSRLERVRKGKSKKIVQYSLSGIFIQEWESSTEASEQLGISQTGIVHCCKGVTKTSGNYIWKYGD